MSLLSGLKKFGKSRCKFQFRASISTQFEVQNINLNSQEIKYVKVGNGPKTILFLNGFLGSFRHDFKMQLQQLDREKFTLVGWDLPGLGLSRPPNRRYHVNYLEEDADSAFEFLNKLNVKKCSLVGWSDGGISSIIFSSKYPKHVENLVLIGVTPYFLEKHIPVLEQIRDMQIKPAIALYGRELAHNVQNNYVDVIMEINKKKNGDICSSHLKNIKCPTLIFHGDADAVVDREHSLYLLQNIRGAKLIRFREGTHNIQSSHSEEFNKWVTKFISNPHEITEKHMLL